MVNNDKLLTADPEGEDEHDEGEWRRFERYPQSQAWHPALLELSPATATEYLDTAVTILLTFIDLLTRHAYVRTTDRT